jgi:hypothetical protein
MNYSIIYYRYYVLGGMLAQSSSSTFDKRFFGAMAAPLAPHLNLERGMAMQQLA